MKLRNRYSSKWTIESSRNFLMNLFYYSQLYQIVRDYSTQSLNLTLLTDPSTISAASQDFGNVTTVIPGGVICPSSPLTYPVSSATPPAEKESSKWQPAAKATP
ncbi:hypothetical protein Rs2_41994 [Raphanus sativus]|nr:hypothetical protein Rs2_41994 [Raphanus sativus]